MRLFIAVFILCGVGVAFSAEADRSSSLDAKVSGAPIHTKLPGTAKRTLVKLTDEVIELAKHVHVGLMPCEMGASVSVTPHAGAPGYFLVRTKTASFLMHPVSSRTGAIRLEDAGAGALWLQLGNKSMLMSQKLGQRLADECVSPEQSVTAQMLRNNPAPGIFDAAPPESAAK